MAKKRKSKLFRGNTKKMLTQGVSLASMFPKLNELEEFQTEDKSAREAEALIEAERLQDEALQSKGQDLWGVSEDEDASPIRIQLQANPSDSTKDAEDRISISEVASSEEGYHESLDIPIDDITEHLRGRYKSIASITEKNHIGDNSRLDASVDEGSMEGSDINPDQPTSLGIVNIFEANLPLEEEAIDDAIIQRREKRYRDREKENNSQTAFKEILSRALLENADENAEESAEENVDEKADLNLESNEVEVPKQVSFEIEKPNVEGNSLDLKESSNEHYIEENFGLDILDSDLFDYHHVNDVPSGPDKVTEKNNKVQETVSNKQLFAQIDKDLREEDSSTDPNIDEIPDVIFSLNIFEDSTEGSTLEEQEQDNIIVGLSIDSSLPHQNNLDVTDPQIPPLPDHDGENFLDTKKEVASESVSIEQRKIEEENSQLQFSDVSSAKVSEKKYFAQPLLPMDEDGVPSVIIEEWDFDDSEDGLDNDVEDPSEVYHVENTEIDNLGYEEEHTVVSSSTPQHKSSGAILYIRENERDEKAIDNKSIDEDNTDGSIFAFDEESVTDGIQVNLGHTDETVLGEDAWNISLEKDEDSEPTIHENARPVPILRLKSKRAQRRRQIPTENFTPISKDELDDGINPILESQRITIGQSSSKFPLFLITFILGVLIFAFVAAC